MVMGGGGSLWASGRALWTNDNKKCPGTSCQSSDLPLALGTNIWIFFFFFFCWLKLWIHTPAWTVCAQNEQLTTCFRMWSVKKLGALRHGAETTCVVSHDPWHGLTWHFDGLDRLLTWHLTTHDVTLYLVMSQPTWHLLPLDVALDMLRWHLQCSAITQDVTHRLTGCTTDVILHRLMTLPICHVALKRDTRTTRRDFWH